VEVRTPAVIRHARSKFFELAIKGFANDTQDGSGFGLVVNQGEHGAGIGLLKPGPDFVLL
jgi:hypothetical protein